MELSNGPQTLTVEEAAKVLRIGRTAAYALAREWRTTKGRSGLPVLELGRTLRVPCAALEAMLAGSPPPHVPEPPEDDRAALRGRRRIDQGQLWETIDGTAS